MRLRAAPYAQGSILVVTLWLVLTLAMVAVALGTYLSTEARLMRVRVARAQAQAWARAGVYLGLEQLASDLASSPDSSDWLGERWARAPQSSDRSTPWTVSLPLEGGGAAFVGSVSVTISDEDRKFPVNRIEDPAMGRLVTALANDARLADLIADYADADDIPRPQGLETQEAPAWYRAKNAPVVVLEELRQIPGFTDEHDALLRQYASPFLPATSTINLNTADPELLRAFFAVADQPALAEQVVAYRWDPADGTSPDEGNHLVQLRPEVRTRGAPLDPGVQDALARVMTGPLGGWLGVQSSTFRMAVTANITTPPVRYQVVAVVRRAGGAAAALQVGGVSFQIVCWQEG